MAIRDTNPSIAALAQALLCCSRALVPPSPQSQRRNRAITSTAKALAPFEFITLRVYAPSSLQIQVLVLPLRLPWLLDPMELLLQL